MPLPTSRNDGQIPSSFLSRFLCPFSRQYSFFNFQSSIENRQLNISLPNGIPDQVRRSLCVQFSLDAAPVILHGPDADLQEFSDLPVRFSLRDEFQDFAFTFCQGVFGLAGFSAGFSTARTMTSHLDMGVSSVGSSSFVSSIRTTQPTSYG